MVKDNICVFEFSQLSAGESQLAALRVAPPPRRLHRLCRAADRMISLLRRR